MGKSKYQAPKENKAKKETKIVEPTVETEGELIERQRFNPLYEEFLAKCSSHEREVYSSDLVKAVPAFRNFIENTPDNKLVELMK